MPKTINLGFQTPDYSNMECCAPSSGDRKEQPTKTAYPCITIPGNASLAKALKPGQELTCMVRFKVIETALRERDGDDEKKTVDMYGGTHVELEAQEITFEGNVAVEEEKEEDGVSAFKRFTDKKKAAKAGNSESDEY